AIIAQTYGGTLTINTTAGGNLTGTDDGIEAFSTTGNISISTNNAITGGALASGGLTQLNVFGVPVAANGGNGIIAPPTTANIVTTPNGVPTPAGASGIQATTAGTVTITNAASITATAGPAIRGATTTGNLTITNSGTIRGLGNSTATAAVNVSTVTTGNITITNSAAGVIRSVAGLASDLAIAVQAGSGSILINNAGRITGRIDLSGAPSSTFNNTSATSWHTSGLNTFTAGNDTLNNLGPGLIATSGNTTFEFLTGTDVINNLNQVVGNTT